MRLPTRSFLSTTALAGAVGLVLVASLGGTSAYFGGALALLAASAAIGLMRADSRVPELVDTQGYITGVLNERGYTGSYSLRDVTQVTSPGIEPGHVLVKFRGSIQFHEPLYQPSAPSPGVLKGIQPRRIEWLRKMADMLGHELGEAATDLATRIPPDPFRATFVAARKQEGWSVPFSGSAWAVSREGGWGWDPRSLSQSIDALVIQGKPMSAYPAALDPHTPEGAAWLRANLEAWKEFEREIAGWQQKLDEARVTRARDAMGGFFHGVQAGAAFHGIGESLTHQVGDAGYLLEVVSAHPDNKGIVFTLRSEKHWQASRTFSGLATFDSASGTVLIQAQTTAADAQPGAGPLLNVARAFELELRWRGGNPARIEGSTVDLLLKLHQVESTELEAILERVHARERSIAAALAPGRSYRGTVHVGMQRSLKLDFLPDMDAGPAVARVECAGSSGMFRLAPMGDAGDAEPMDVALEPTARAAAPASQAGVPSLESWNRVLLRLQAGRLSGVALAGEHRLAISELSPQNVSGI